MQKAKRLGKRELLERLVEVSEANVDDLERTLRELSLVGDQLKAARAELAAVKQSIKELRVLTVTRPNAEPPVSQEQIRREWMFGKDGEEA